LLYLRRRSTLSSPSDEDDDEACCSKLAEALLLAASFCPVSLESEKSPEKLKVSNALNYGTVQKYQ
jgi:hypothetical protein